MALQARGELSRAAKRRTVSALDLVALEADVAALTRHGDQSGHQHHQPEPGLVRRPGR